MFGSQLLDSFRALLARKRHEVSAARSRYEVGLEKLAATEESVTVGEFV